jgi:hypothetical protein
MHTLPFIALLAALAGTPTRAPSAEEQRLYEEGLRALQSGDARAAEKAWKGGYAVGRDPAFLIYIGEAQEKAGAPAEAAETYRRYLREVPDAADRADIEQRLARVAPAGTPPAQPGAAESVGELGGAQGATPSLRPPPGFGPDARRADAEQPAAKADADDSGWNRYNMTAVISSGAALLLFGTAGFFAASAGSASADVNRLVTYRNDMTGAPLSYSTVAAQYEQAVADGERNDRWAKRTLYAALGATAVAAVFFVLDAKLGGEPAVVIAPAGNGIAATGGWTWRF